MSNHRLFGLIIFILSAVLVAPPFAQEKGVREKLAANAAITGDEAWNFYRSDVLDIAKKDFVQAYANLAVFNLASEKSGYRKEFGQPDEHKFMLESAANNLLANASFRMGKEAFSQEDVFYDLFDVMRCKELQAATQAKIIFKQQLDKQNPAAKTVFEVIRASRTPTK